MTFYSKTIAFILLSFTTMALASCDRKAPQATSAHPAQPAVALGDTVEGVGSEITCIIQDRNGHYWFVSNGEGLFRHDGKTFIQYTEKDGLCSNNTRDIQEDLNGHLWIGTREGICKFDGKAFTDMTEAIQKAPFGPFTYSQGGLFFPHQDGICFYNGSSFQNFAIHPTDYTPSPSSTYREYNVYCTLVDRSGKVWFGTQEKGVCYFDGEKFRFLDQMDLGGPAVRAIFQDRNGVIWFGNNGGGLYRYDGEKLRNITEEKKLSNHDFLRGKKPIDKEGNMARVFAINEDEVGNLWIGTVDAGVWKYDGSTLTNFTDKDGLNGNTVPMIFKDKKGKLWFASYGGTLRHFDGQRFVHTGIRQPLPY